MVRQGSCLVLNASTTMKTVKNGEYMRQNRSLKVPESFKDTTMTITNLEAGSIYEIQLIAVATEQSNISSTLTIVTAVKGKISTLNMTKISNYLTTYWPTSKCQLRANRIPKNTIHVEST